jgi:hypothetical protein
MTETETEALPKRATGDVVDAEWRRLGHAGVAHVEAQIADLSVLRAELKARRLDLADGPDQPHDEVVPGRRTHISNPTQARALYMAQDARIRHLEHVIRAIETVRDDPQFAPWAPMLVWLRYEKAWSNHELAAVLGVSVATVYRMRRVLVTQVAAHLGW